MKGIYRFYWDCGRSGSIKSIFVADSEDVKEIIGKCVYFGEVLGKHSEVFGEIKEKEITLISDDPKDVEFFERLKLESGLNPFDYYYEEEVEEDE